MKNSQVHIKRVKGKMTFVLPNELAKKIKEVYSFNLDQLRVGGDIPLHDLAVHMDQHAALEASASMAAEQARHLKELELLAFEMWYESWSNEVRVSWFNKHDKWPTEKQNHGELLSEHAKEYKKRKTKLVELDSAYRILNNVIKSAVQVKGDMLRSMRPLLQSDGNFVGSINIEVADKTRKDLSSISFKSKKK